MLSFFKPATDRIKRLLQQQIESAEKEAPGCPINVRTMILST